MAQIRLVVQHEDYSKDATAEGVPGALNLHRMHYPEVLDAITDACHHFFLWVELVMLAFDLV